jgi:hypothetical protein
MHIRLLKPITLLLLLIASEHSRAQQPTSNDRVTVIPFETDRIGGDDRSAGMAITNPDRYAWELFAMLNQPSGENDGSVVWENWGLARLIYADPNISQVNLEAKWLDGTLRKPDSAKRTDRFDSLPIQQQILRDAREKFSGHTLSLRSIQPHAIAGFDPNLTGVGTAQPENDEVRMNWSAFKSVVDNNLYSIDGQEAAFESGKPVSFEREAKEIKAEWRQITGLPDAVQKTFHTATFTKNDATEVWGLVALHITTKDLPNWFWATWEHESTSQRESVVPSRDSWGAKLIYGDEQFNVYDRLQGAEKGDLFPAGSWAGPSDQLAELFKRVGLTEEKWSHYVLRGTQVDFTDKFGRPTILANSVIEEGFQDTSSCMTCHAKAGIGPRLRRSLEKNMLPVFASDLPPVGDIGLPNPEWFFGKGTMPPNRKYLQFDFVWSTIRAKRKGLADTNSDTASMHPLYGKWTYRALMNSDKEVKDQDVGEVTLGTGVLDVEEVDEFGRFKGTLSINESTTPDRPWRLAVAGTASFDDHKWTLEFEAKGTSKENDGKQASGGNIWHYEYEASSFKSSMKFVDPANGDGRVPAFAGRVTRVVKHPTGEAARKLRDPQSGVAIKDLDPTKDFYPAGFTGTFQMVKQATR